MQYTVETYQSPNGSVPYQESFESLRDQQAKVRIMRRVQRAMLGNLGDHHSLGGGLHEMRIDYGPGYRIYFSWSGQAIIILFLAGDKSNQDSDIQKARAFLDDFRSRQ